MRPVLLGLVLVLGPVPGRGGGRETTTARGGCAPRPPGVTEPCGHREELEVTATPAGFAPPPEATGRDIIPVYCSLLAAVVVGLLAYVAFKCWHTCRQKRQLAKARAGDPATSPEGEKVRGGDAGVFLDTPSLQELHQPGKAPRPEGHPLSPAQDELERLLESGGQGGDTVPRATGAEDVASAV